MFKSIKKAIGQVWTPVTTTLNVVDTSAQLIDDTVSTYGNEILISNASVRNEQLKQLESLERVVTNNQIAMVLSGKQVSDEQVKAETQAKDVAA